MDLRAFQDELEHITKEKVAIDPVTAAGIGAGAKIMAANLLTRHGTKIPGFKQAIQRIGAEAVGLGARQGAMGLPMVSRPTREAVAALVEPHLVKAYEAGHAAGKALGPVGLLHTRAAAKGLQRELNVRAPELAKGLQGYTDIIEKARLAPTKADVLFLPVGETAERAGLFLKDVLKEMLPSSSKLSKAVKADKAIPAKVRA